MKLILVNVNHAILHLHSNISNKNSVCHLVVMNGILIVIMFVNNVIQDVISALAQKKINVLNVNQVTVLIEDIVKHHKK